MHPPRCVRTETSGANCESRILPDATSVRGVRGGDPRAGNAVGTEAPRLRLLAHSEAYSTSCTTPTPRERPNRSISDLRFILATGRIRHVLFTFDFFLRQDLLSVKGREEQIGPSVRAGGRFPVSFWLLNFTDTQRTNTHRVHKAYSNTRLHHFQVVWSADLR